MRKQILGLALRYQGEWEKITEGLKQGEKPPCPEIAAPYVTWADAESPSLLRQLRLPPWILFDQGNLASVAQPADRRAERPDRRYAGGISQRHNADGQRSDRAEPGGLVSALSRKE